MKQARDMGTMSAVIRIVALYVLFSGLWIYFSDTILGRIIHDPDLVTRLAIYKGFAFILVTATLLYFLIARYAVRMAEINRRLRASEVRCHTIFDSIYETILVMNPATGMVTDVNRTMTDMYGYSREEALGMDIQDLMGESPFSRKEALEHLLAAARGVPQLFEWRSRRKDGSLFWVEVSMRIAPLDGGDRLVVLVRDITDRVEFAKEASFFRSLVEFTRDPVYVLDPNDGWRMVYVNQAACSHYGMDMERILTMRIPDWDPAFDMENTDVLWQRMKNGEAMRFETVHRVSSGDLVPVEVTSSYLEHNGRELCAGYFHNISERKAMELALRESERNLIEAQRIARVGNWARDLSGNLLYASPECRRIYGREAGLTPGTFDTFLELVHPDDRVRVRATFEGTVRTGQPFLADFGIFRPDGSERIIRARGEMVVDDTGTPEKIIGTVQDITEQRRAEADRIELERQLLNIQKLESLGVLAGGIAHDFNNLLTGILGNLSMMRLNLPADNPLHDKIGRCEKAVHQATGLTCQLLTFSRGGDPVKKLFDLVRVIRDAVSFSLHGSNVAVEMKISDDLWPVDGDEGQIGQVLHNLLINADQAMPQGGIVRVEACNQRLALGQVSSLEPGAYVLVSVIDQGSGIPPENLDKIFDPYFTTKKTGTGLGLTALHSIVRKHGGQVLVSSRVGTGSVFRVYLPASPERGRAEGGAEYATSSPAPTGEGYILVMDDEEIIRDMAKEMLSLLGYRVETCSSGEEVIELYGCALKRGEKPAAVIMDLTIPGKMGGLEASAAIHALDSTAVLIVSSGYSHDPVLADFGKYGFSDSLAKPFRLEDLGAVLRRVLDARLVRDEGRV
jgi:PAS domain S-box-containing protein